MGHTLDSRPVLALAAGEPAAFTPAFSFPVRDFPMAKSENQPSRLETFSFQLQVRGNTLATTRYAIDLFGEPVLLFVVLRPLVHALTTAPAGISIVQTEFLRVVPSPVLRVSR